MSLKDTAVALVHHPVRNRRGKTVTTSLTNLDIHDIARSCATFGVKKLYIVTPLPEQRKIARETLDYWTRGPGATWNRDRQKALSKVAVVSDIAEILEDLKDPTVIATSAKRYPETVSFEKISFFMEKNRGHKLILLGTGWGLTGSVVKSCNYILEPITGQGRYNHLSVRSAAAIILDRLFNSRRKQ